VELQESVKFSFVAIKVKKWRGFTQACKFRADSMEILNCNELKKVLNVKLTFHKEIAVTQIRQYCLLLDRVPAQSLTLSMAIVQLNSPKNLIDTS
jgi:hypothetical protein